MNCKKVCAFIIAFCLTTSLDQAFARTIAVKNFILDYRVGSSKSIGLAVFDRDKKLHLPNDQANPEALLLEVATKMLLQMEKGGPMELEIDNAERLIVSGVNPSLPHFRPGNSEIDHIRLSYYAGYASLDQGPDAVGFVSHSNSTSNSNLFREIFSKIINNYAKGEPLAITTLYDTWIIPTPAVAVAPSPYFVPKL